MRWDSVSVFAFQVGPEDDGSRLDIVLCRRVPAMNRAQANTLASRGRVFVNGAPAKKSQLARTGDRITLAELPIERDFRARPDPSVAIAIVRETKEYVVVEKPAGVPSHPLRPDETANVASGLVARYPEMRDVGYAKREPGIVHRLDTHTSGLMLAGRCRSSFEALRGQLREGRIEKRYLALCVGRVGARGPIVFPIGNDPDDDRKVRVVGIRERPSSRPRARNPKPARTDIIDVSACGDFSLVEVRANSARRHQVRAHLASIGHPLAGDLLYGGPRLAGLTRHFLHASALAFVDPSSARRVHCESKLPPELVRVADRLSQVR